MKILVWTTKHESLYYNASTPEQELKAFLFVFNEMDGNGDYDCCPPEGKTQKALYKKAKKGDSKAARTLLSLRSADNYEYENIVIEEVYET